MKKDDIETQNATLQKELTGSNELYYSNLIIYVRTKALIRDNQKVEELLLEILQDILEAQSKGITAETYFGKNPKEIADEIISSLPINLLDAIKLIFTGFGAYLLFTIIPSLIFNEKTIDIGTFLITGIFATFLVFSILWVVGTTLYRINTKVGQWLMGGGLAVGFLLLLFIGNQISTPFKVHISNNSGIVMIIIIGLVLAILFAKEEDKSIWLPSIPILVIAASLGILTRIELFSSFTQTETGKIFTSIALFIGGLFSFLLIYLTSQKNKKM